MRSKCLTDMVDWQKSCPGSVHDTFNLNYNEI